MEITPHLNHIDKAVLMGVTVRTAETAYPVAEITVLLFLVYFAIVSFILYP